MSISYFFSPPLPPLPPGGSERGVRSVLRRFLDIRFLNIHHRHKMSDIAANAPKIPPTRTGVDGESLESLSVTLRPVSEGLEDWSLAAVASRPMVVRRPPGKVAVVKVDCGLVIPESLSSGVELSDD